MPMTGPAISAARPRLVPPLPPPSSALSPWRTPPAACSRALPVSSNLGSSAGRRRPPPETTVASVSHYAEEPLPRLRLRSGCSRAQRSPGATMSAVELQPSLALKAKAMELAQTLKGTSIFLVGMNNTLKSSLGKALADALRYYYFDSDSLVEEAAGGESAASALRERDESGFRESETEVLKQLSSMGRLVVCTGDGAVQNATNLGYLRYGISIWVDVPLHIVADEVLKSEIQFPNAQDTSTSDSFDQITITHNGHQLTEPYMLPDEMGKLASKLGYNDLSTVTSEDMALETLREIEKLTRAKKMMEDAARPF